jgi:hypothetical protein
MTERGIVHSAALEHERGIKLVRALVDPGLELVAAR